MKKITLLFLFLLPVAAMPQSAQEKIQSYLNENRAKLGLTAQDINGWIVESTGNSTSTNIDNFYIKQRHAGIEIHGAVSNVWIKNGQVINIGDRFVPSAAQKINTTSPSLTVLEGLYSAFGHLNVNNSGPLSILETVGDKNFTISNGVLSDDPVTAELVYQLTEDNNLRLAWDYMFYTPDFRHLWSVRIDAVDGKVLDKQDLVINCTFGNVNHTNHNHRGTAFTKGFFKETQSVLEIQSGSYRVLPYNVESPNHGPRELLVNPHNITASPFGWHDTDGVAGANFTVTRGNNVLAVEDADGNNAAGVSPNGTATLSFDYPYNGTSSLPSSYQSAAITNLFYMNNMMHDVWFNYGFNESNGSFQQKNYTGFANTLGGDAVQADAQDGSTLEPQNINNANFSTPPDGQKPRMQMYLWNVLPPAEPLHILSPSDIAGTRVARDNSFNPGHVPLPVAPNMIQSELVLYNDGSGDTTDACTAPINAADINGKITIVRRGDCTFIEKVLFCQNAGATAVIVVNNVPGVIGMAGANAAVTIPAISVTQEVGEALISRVMIETVTAKIQLIGEPFVNADGDFDNGIIAHEYGHGITNRLTGGASNAACLTNAEQAGEGWSDWFALMMQMKAGDDSAAAKGIASFAASQPIVGGGIRSFPYSTDMSVNPLTFSDTNTTAQHDRGEVMAAVLWDLAWAYVNKYGFDSNIFTGTGGNNKVMRLVIDALKLQPCNPTFIEFRNAVIAADQATTNGADYCMIWEVFARRGMGVNASSGLRTSATDQVADFNTPNPGPNCTLAVNYFNADDMIRVYPNPSNGYFTIKISQFSGKLNFTVVDVNGRIVYSKRNEQFNAEKQVDLTHLQSGMYILKVDGNDLNYTKKIIVK